MIAIISQQLNYVILSHNGKKITIEKNVSPELFDKISNLINDKNLSNLENICAKLLTGKGHTTSTPKRRVVKVDHTVQMHDKLYGMKAKEVIAYVKKNYGKTIKMDLKNKAGIVKKALSIVLNK